MRSFVARYKQDWDELEALLNKARRSVSRLTIEERERLDALYRRVTIHLAMVRTRTTDAQLVSYLNRLTATAHSIIYLPKRSSMLERLGRFATDDFAQAVARSGRLHLASLILFVAGGLVGFFVSCSDPLLAHAMWPRQDTRQPGSTSEQLLDHLRLGRDQSGSEKFIFASFLFQHNLKVGILALASGVLAAVPTVFLMLFNGMLLGAFVAIHYQVGIHAELWAWLLPHGITEIGAIILCGGVGLMLGRAVVQPGVHSRKLALTLAGKEAAKICCGVAVMLVAAAVIESYVRQSHWSTITRLVFAGGTALFWIAYFARGWWLERIHHRVAPTVVRS